MNQRGVDTVEECWSFQSSLLRLIEALSFDREPSAEAAGTFGPLEGGGPYAVDRSVP
ncbi:MAG: hypothetical protein ACKV22_16270 [Bryobacteraceae bacterium]